MCDESYNVPSSNLLCSSNTTSTSSHASSNTQFDGAELFQKRKLHLYSTENLPENLNEKLMLEESKENLIETQNINENSVEFKDNFNKANVLLIKKRFRSNELNSLLEQHVRMSYLDYKY